MSDQVTPFYFKTVVGMDNRSDVLDFDGKKVSYAQNCRFGVTPGAMTKRPPLAYYNSSEVAGSGGMLGAYRYYFSGGAKLITVRDKAVYVGDDSAGTLTKIRDLENSGRRMAFVTYNNLCIGGNGYDNIWVYDGSSDNVTWELGSCKAKLSSAAGSITKTGVSYMITYDNDAYICGAISNEVDATAKDIELTNIPLGPTGSDHRKIYRKDSSTGTAYKFVAEITDDAAETYTDAIASVSANATVGSVTDDMPKGNILTIHKERLFISGNPVDQNRFWYSNPFLFHYIQADTNLDYMDIAKDDGDQIQGLKIHMGTMICIKQNTIRKVFVAASSANVDPATWYADDPFSFTGSPAQWSICETPLGIMFLGWDKWYLFNGGTCEPFLPSFNASKILPSLYNNVVAYFNNSKLYASYADLETAPQNNNRVMVYDTTVDQYSLDTITANCFAASIGADESGELFIGSADSGFVWKAEEGDIWHRAASLSDLKNGSISGMFLGGPEGNPILQIGQETSPLAIPEGTCIFWEDESSGPGSGWTEISNDGKFVLISATSGSTGGTSVHTHTLSGSLSADSAGSLNAGDNGGAWMTRQHHTHSLSISATDGSAYPRNVQFRVFQKNASTTEYGFPVGAIMMWDQAAAPDGWIALSYLNDNYVRMGSTDLGTATSVAHGHDFTGSSSGPTGSPENDDAGAGSALSASNHTHTVTGTTLSTDTSTWDLDAVSFLFIKKVSESAPWDGTDKYVYALFYGVAAASNGWEDVTSTYLGKYLHMGSSLSTKVKANYAHTHDILDDTSSLGSGYNGPGGYQHQALEAHTHPFSATAADADLPDPEFLTFRIFRKLLGKTVTYNDAITNKYTNGLYVSPALSINAESFGDMFFNAETTGSDFIRAYFRTGATEALVSDGLALTVDHTNDKFTAVSHGYLDGDRVSISAVGLPTGILDTVLYYVVNVSGSDFKVSLSLGGSPVGFSSNGTTVTSKKWSDQVVSSGYPISAAVNIWVQYIFEFVCADTTVNNATLFYADGYVVKFNYRKAGATAESAVEFIYETGIMNHQEPMVDKIYKRMAIEHTATAGALDITWTTDNDTNVWSVDLSRFQKHWSSFFHDNAMGSYISIRFYKNDLEDLTLREFKGMFVTQPVLI